MLGLIWIQAVRHSDGIHKKVEKVDFQKKNQKKIFTRQKSMQNYPAGNSHSLLF